MYCKHCGKQIANDSAFCQYCGSSQIAVLEETKNEYQNVKVELGGELKASLNPSLPKFTSLRKICNEHIAIVLTYSVWLILNILFLINGDNENGFWPHIYSNKVPKETEWDWDLDRYGLSEFIIYVVLVPLIIFIGYRIYLYYDNKQSSHPNKYIIGPDDWIWPY